MTIDVRPEEDQLPTGLADAYETIEKAKEPESKDEQPPKDEPTPAPADPEEDFAQKYHTLQGKYNAETARYRGDIENLTAQLSQIEAQMRQAPAQPMKDEPQSVDRFAQLRENGYDDEILGVLEKQEKEINDLRQQTEEVRTKAAESAQQIFERDLTRDAPKWIELNNDPGFMAWAEEKIPMTNITRLDALRSAAKRGDSKATADVFNEYLKSIDKPAARKAQPDIMPGTSTGGGAPVQEPRITIAEIKKFRSRIAHGQERDPKKIHEFESKVRQAQQAGEIA